MWSHGFDIQHSDDDSKRRWVCRPCIDKKRRRPHNTVATGTQNAENHLFFEHNIWDQTGKRRAPVKVKEKTPSKSITSFFNLNPNNPREQQIASTLIGGFSREKFQQLLVAWVIDSQGSFRQIENQRFRDLLEYLNPLVSITDAHICHDTVRSRILEVYNTNKAHVVEVLGGVEGKVHIAFDGWRSRNRHAMYGIVCFFLDSESRAQKLVLGIPEIVERHTGKNIAVHVLDIIASYEISSKLGYFTLDNAANNDTAMDTIGTALEFKGRSRRVRCFGHILNLVCKQLLFGHDADAFEDEISADSTVDASRHEAWRRKGPIGKLHNLVVVIHKSDVLTQLLRDLQQKAFDISEDPKIKANRPKDTVMDNLTRWLSQLYMLRRCLELRPFLEELWANQRAEFDASIRKRSKRKEDMPLYIRDESEITEKDWIVAQLYHDVLTEIEDVLLVLEGDGQFRARKNGFSEAYGTIRDVVFAYEHLLTRFEHWKAMAMRYPDAEHFKININLAWKKLNEYYEKLDETPVYYAAVALHPAYRWAYFENWWSSEASWIDTAKKLVQELWDSEYRHLSISSVRSLPSDIKRRKFFHTKFNKNREESRQAPLPSQQVYPTIDEYEEWQRLHLDSDQDVVDPLSYWHEKRSLYPRLAQMALDVLSVPPMSADVERLFSSCGGMLDSSRNRLEANTIGIVQTLRSWQKAGLVQTKDHFLQLPESYERSLKEWKKLTGGQEGEKEVSGANEVIEV
jgi:hypothetical protein